MKHPIIVGLKSMANGMFAFGWFAISAVNAWKVGSADGWLAVWHFILFASSAAYGIWCLYELGKMKLRKKRG